MQIPTKTYIRKFAGDAVDLGSWAPPTRQRITDEGEILIEKLPSAAHALMLKPSGTEANVQLHNGMGRPRANDPYKSQIGSEKMAKGFLPMYTCPKLLGLHKWLPKDLQATPPCSLGAKKPEERVSDENPCNCIVETQKVRRKVARKINDDQERRQQTRESKDYAQREKQNDLLVETLQTLVDQKAAPEPEPEPAAVAKPRARRTKKDDE